MCNIDKSHLILYIYDELDVGEKSLFEKHLQECQECQSETQYYRAILNKLSNLPSVEPSKLPQIDLIKTRNKMLSLMTYGAIAASFLLLAIISYFKIPTPTQPNPDIVRTTNEQIASSTPTPEDSEKYSWDNGFGDEINNLKENTDMFISAIKTPATVSFDNTITEIDNRIKSLSAPGGNIFTK
jgi:hypothetical protein